MSDQTKGWKPLDPSVLQARLREVKRLLEQAAAVGMAQDLQKLEKVADLAHKQQKEKRGPAPTKRYR